MKHVDIIVIGDELEGIHTAVSAARAGASVVLAKTINHRWLGGLSTRGGLAYMDISREYLPPLFKEFLALANVRQVCLEPHHANAVLRHWCQEANIPIVMLGKGPYKLSDGFFQLIDDEGHCWQAPILIDATADADMAVQLGVPFINGLGNILGENAPNHIGISPVFTLSGVSVADLMSFEADLREQPGLSDDLIKALPFHTEAERMALIDRPCFSPAGADYLDILNPVIGIAFHRWRYGNVDRYGHADAWIDGGNVALLPDGRMSFNGLVAPAPPLETLLAWSHQPFISAHLHQAMQAFEDFLRQAGNFASACVEAPEYLYIRQTRHVHTRRMASARDMLMGGSSASKSLGTYSYWLDTRGINLRQCEPGLTHFPKPVFGVALENSLCAGIDNLAVVGRSAGYGPLAQGIGRIVQHNCLLGEGLGITAALASHQKIPLHKVPVEAVQLILCERGAELDQPVQDFSGSALEPAIHRLLALEEALLFKETGQLC